MNDLVLKNCKLTHIDGEYYIGIENGKINEISKLPLKFDKEIDINGQIILPGLIDPHVHFRDPGLRYKEDFKSGSESGANGGFTSVIDMPNTIPKTNTYKAFKEKTKLANKKSIINTYLHAGFNSVKEMEKISTLNPISFKIFMDLESDESLNEIFKNISLLEESPLITLHCENKRVVHENTKLLKSNKKQYPIDYAYGRPSEAEDVSVAQAIDFAEKYDLKLHICHLSSKKSLEIVKNAKIDISYEFTPHHLLLEANGFNKFNTITKTNPPLRFYGENITVKNIEENTIIGTDHAPHTLEEKNKGVWDSFPGIPNLETCLGVLLTEVNRNNLDLKLIPKILSENPAKRFNLKNKGFIKKGYDGDLTVIDLNKEGTFDIESFYTKAEYSPFENYPYKGLATMTIVNGEVVMKDNELYT